MTAPRVALLASLLCSCASHAPPPAASPTPAPAPVPPPTPAPAPPPARPIATSSDGWQRFASPFDTGNLVAVDGAAANDVWLASRTGLAHFDGARWTEVLNVPAFAHGPVDSEAPIALYVAGRDDLWLVGPNDVHPDEPAMHWNGHSWAGYRMPSLTPLGVDGSAPDDVWAVGLSATIAHWDGRAWTAVDAGGSMDGFARVWAVARDAAWLVGWNFSWGHWDGQHWKTQAYGPGFFFDVSGTAVDDVWIVGRPEAPQRPPPPYRPRPIQPFVIPSDPNAVYSIQHWDGHTWTVSPGAPSEEVHAVCASARDRAWAVGPHGHAWRWDGARWTVSNTGAADASLGSVYCAPGGEVWAVGAAGTLLHHPAG